MIRVSINGKYLSALVEGMPRVARQIVLELDVLLSSAPYAEDFDVELLFPPGCTPPDLRSIRPRQVGRLSGQLWEQLEFPLYSMGRIGLNFTSTGPVMKRNCVTLLHDAQMFSTPQSFGRRNLIMYRLLGPSVGHLHRAITTASLFAREDMERYRVVGRGRAIIIPHGADHMGAVPLDDSVLEKHGLTGRRFLLSHALVHAHKNIEVVCRAFELLGRARADLSLVLFGQHDRAYFENRNIPVPRGSVFVGRVSDSELKGLMRSATLFLFPSTTEGFGLPPLEAMYLGTPCVVSRGGALPEVCGDGAAYADAHDAAAWAATVGELLDDERARLDLARRGQRRAESFRWISSAERYLDVLKSLTRT